MVTEKLCAILKALEEKFPPPGPCHHNFSLQSDGLQLNLAIDDMWWRLLVDADDLDKPVDEILREVEEVLFRMNGFEQEREP